MGHFSGKNIFWNDYSRYISSLFKYYRFIAVNKYPIVQYQP